MQCNEQRNAMNNAMQCTMQDKPKQFPAYQCMQWRTGPFCTLPRSTSLHFMLCHAIQYKNGTQLFFQNISRVNVQCRASKQRTSWVVHTKLVGVLLLQSWLNKKQRMQSRLQSCAEFRLSSWILSPAKGSPELIMAAPCNIRQHHNFPLSQLSSTYIYICFLLR